MHKKTPARKFILFILIFPFLPLCAFSTTHQARCALGCKALQDSIYTVAPGDTILLEKGTYYAGDLGDWGLVLRDSISVIFQGAGECIISARSADGLRIAKHAVTVSTAHLQSTQLLLQGVTIRDGSAVAGQTPLGGGLFCYRSGLRVMDCVIEHNAADSLGGGLCAIDSRVVLDGLTVVNNNSLTGGGAFFSDCDLQIRNSSFQRNRAMNGGGAFISGGAPALDSVQFLSNHSDSIGGGLFLYHTAGSLWNCLFANDTSYNAGGLCLLNASPQIALTTVRNNYARGGGGVFLMMHSAPVMSDCAIKGNAAYEGGGMYMDSCGSDAILTRCFITNNSAVGYGGGFHLSNSSPTLSFNRISGNISQDGAGMFTFRSHPSFFKNVIVENTSTGYGGGIYIYGESHPTMNGDLVANNRTSYGGGMYFEYLSSVAASRCTIAGNIARIGGAFVTVEQSKPAFTQCLFVDNGAYENSRNGLAQVVVNSGGASIENSNSYYNTYQPGIELSNDLDTLIDLKNNYWALSTQSGIESILSGRHDISGFRSDFVPGAPGEPTAVQSVSFIDFRTGAERIVVRRLPDTLLIRARGTDRNPGLYDAVCAIVKSSAYPGGISVALVETDTASGIFEGKIFLEPSSSGNIIFDDDPQQILRVIPGGDNIICEATFHPGTRISIPYTPITEIENVAASSVQSVIIATRDRLFLNVVRGTSEIFAVYNSQGRKLLDAGSDNNIDITSLTAGAYFVFYKSGSFTEVKKITVLR